MCWRGGGRQLCTRSHYKLRRRHRAQCVVPVPRPVRPFSHSMPLKFDIFCEHLLRVFSTRVIDVLRLCAQCVAIETHYRHTDTHTRRLGHRNGSRFPLNIQKTHTHTHFGRRGAHVFGFTVRRCNRRFKAPNWQISTAECSL